MYIAYSDTTRVKTFGPTWTKLSFTTLKSKNLNLCWVKLYEKFQLTKYIPLFLEGVQVPLEVDWEGPSSSWEVFVDSECGTALIWNIQFLVCFLAFDFFVGSAWSFGFFIPDAMATGLRLWRISIPDLIHYIIFLT